jgi:hypothetical protein
MHHLIRAPAISTCLLLSLGASTSSRPVAGSQPTGSQPTSPPATTPQATLPSASLPPISPPASYRYDISTSRPPADQFHRVSRRVRVRHVPGEPDVHSAAGSASGRTVEPEVCRTVIRTGGLTVPYGDFVPTITPAASAQVDLGAPVGDLLPYAFARIFGLTGADADRYTSIST